MTATPPLPKLSLKTCRVSGCTLNARPGTCVACGRRIPDGYPRHHALNADRQWVASCCPCAAQAGNK